MGDDKKIASRSLFSAVNNGDLEQVQDLVKRYGLWYSPDFYGGYVPLYNAVQAGHYEIAKFLLQNCVAVDNGTSNPDSPLYYAARCGDPKLVQFLLDEEAPVDFRKKQNEALNIAIQRGRENVVQLLLKRGANPNAVIETSNQEPSQPESEKGSTEASGHLQEKNSDVNGKTEGNRVPLHLAVEVGRSKIVEMLLNYGAHVNARTTNGSTPLLLAAKHNLSTICKTLLKAGACVNSKDENNNSPLYYSVKLKNLYLINSILQYKPDFDSKVRESVLHMITCSDKKWHEIVDKFVDHGFMPNHDDVNNPNLLQAAVRTGYTKLVKLLVNSGCDVNVKDALGYTPIFYSVKSPEITKFLCSSGAAIEYLPDLLHRAVSEQNIEICKILIRNKVDVNSRHLDGRTPLHQAVSKRPSRTGPLASLTDEIPTDLTLLLLSKEADVSLKTSTGFTALHLAIVHGNAGDVSCLITFEADVNSLAEDGSTPLLLACVQGNVQIVDILLQHGASLSTFQANGLTALHIAALRGHAEVVQRLLNHEVDINMRGASNETALHCGIIGKEPEVVAVLLENRCDVNLENNNGETALSLAFANAEQPPDDDDEQIIDALVVLQGRSVRHHDVVTTLQNHVIKLSAAGFYVSDKNSRLLDQNSEFYLKCVEEISRMKLEILHENFTLHDVLMKQSRYPRHMADEDLAEKLKVFDYSEYPIYESWLVNTVEKSRERILLLTGGRDSLVTLLKTGNVLNEKKSPVPPLEMLEEIVAFLNKKDLENLISCGRGLRCQLVGRRQIESGALDEAGKREQIISLLQEFQQEIYARAEAFQSEIERFPLFE